MKKQLNKKPILVTGSHRCGSTWVGKMLVANDDIGYIHEPFNVTRIPLVNPVPFTKWFTYKKINFKELKTLNIFQNILTHNYPIYSNLKRTRSIRNMAELIRDKVRSTYYRLSNKRPLIKDPIALFSAEWLQHNFDMDVVIVVRHPAAFCSSLKIKNWHFDFNDFLSQDDLISDHLEEFRTEIETFSKQKQPVVEQAILLWNCFHHVILKYSQKHPDWIIVKHEDLSTSPIDTFKTIYEKLNIPFTQKTLNAIKLSTGSHNSAEQIKNNEYVRDSKENIKNWKKRLTLEEIDKIKHLTTNASNHFYTEKDWA